MSKNYDVVVVGAGSGGLTTAVGFSKVGKSVLLVEKEHLGGECTNSGCIPSKALLHHAKTYHLAKEIGGESPKSEAFRAEAFSYVRSKINEILRDETPETFEAMGIDVILGEAKFVDKCSIDIDGTNYKYKTAVIATGSSPRLVEIDGLKEKDILTNQNLFGLDTIPKKTLIIGSGPIGLEMGQALSMLGSEVTIASIDDSFAKLEDPAISEIIENKFTKLGIKIELNVHIEKVENGKAIFNRQEKDKTSDNFSVSFNKVLIAIGRVPNLPTGLEKAAIKFDKYGIQTDSQFRTSNKYVYALGDVSQKLKFTHTADDAGRQVVTRVVSKGLLRVHNKKAVPKVTYTQPAMAQVGLSWNEAKSKYLESELMRIEVPFSDIDRAVTENVKEGLLVVIVKRLSGSVLGANLIGPNVGEILSIYTLAIDQKISMWKLRRLIYPYPTYSLIIKKAGDQFFSRQINSLKTDLLQVTKKHIPKIIALFFWAAVIYSFQSYRIGNELSYEDILLQLLNFFTGTMYGPLVFMVLYAIRPLILFPATLLTALSGALFGFWWGVIYTVIGENASANLAYWIGRFFGKDLRLEDSLIGNWVEALRKRPFGSVLFMRLFYFPFDLTNIGSGVLKVKWFSYTMATLIGIMPGLTTFVALGAAVDIETFKMDGLSFDVFDPKYLGLSLTIFIVSLTLSKLFKRLQSTK